MAKPNTYTLCVSEIEPGIELDPSKKTNYWELRLGGEFQYYRIWLGIGPMKTVPRHRDGKLIRSAISRLGSHARLILPSDTWRGALLRLTVRDLYFPFESHAHDLEITAGAIGKKPVVQFGRPGEIELKDQVFVLEHGESIFVADRKGAVAVVTCSDSGLFMREATKEELVRRIERTALTAANLRTVDWAIRVLGTLRVPVRKALEEYRACLA